MQRQDTSISNNNNAPSVTTLQNQPGYFSWAYNAVSGTASIASSALSYGTGMITSVATSPYYLYDYTRSAFSKKVAANTIYSEDILTSLKFEENEIKKFKALPDYLTRIILFELHEKNNIEKVKVFLNKILPLSFNARAEYLMSYDADEFLKNYQTQKPEIFVTIDQLRAFRTNKFEQKDIINAIQEFLENKLLNNSEERKRQLIAQFEMLIASCERLKNNINFLPVALPITSDAALLLVHFGYLQREELLILSNYDRLISSELGIKFITEGILGFSELILFAEKNILETLITHQSYDYFVSCFQQENLFKSSLTYLCSKILTLNDLFQLKERNLLSVLLSQNTMQALDKKLFTIDQIISGEINIDKIDDVSFDKIDLEKLRAKKNSKPKTKDEIEEEEELNAYKTCYMEFKNALTVLDKIALDEFKQTFPEVKLNNYYKQLEKIKEEHLRFVSFIESCQKKRELFYDDLNTLFSHLRNNQASNEKYRNELTILKQKHPEFANEIDFLINEKLKVCFKNEFQKSLRFFSVFNKELEEDVKELKEGVKGLTQEFMEKVQNLFTTSFKRNR